MSKNQANHTATRREDWETPPEIFGPLEDIGFSIDLCANHDNAKVADYISEHEDIFSEVAVTVMSSAPLEGDYAWINPPYRRGGGTGPFVSRATKLCDGAGIGLVALIPASVGSKWWKEHVEPHMDLFVFPRRFSFTGAPGNAQFDCAICAMVLPGDRHRVASILQRLGNVYEVTR